MTNLTFPKESALVEQSLEPVSRFFWNGSNTIRMRREMSVGRTIADVVILMTSNNHPYQLRPFNILESAVVARLRKSGTTRIDLLEERCGFDRGLLRSKSLRRLFDWGIVRFGQGGQIALAEGWLKDSYIVAIEAKLKKWKEALGQAVQYQCYADESYVLLPESSSDAAVKSENAFESSGVGLLVFGGGSVARVVSAKKCTEHNWRREFVYSRLTTQMPFVES